jgi:hypothetical protein
LGLFCARCETSGAILTAAGELSGGFYLEEFAGPAEPTQKA